MPNKSLKVCIIQTAFPGDVVLALGMVESIKAVAPTAQISLVVRDGNQGLVKGHSGLDNIHIWHKKTGKLKSIWALGKELRQQQYDVVINAQRFFSSGLITWLTGAPIKIGFSKNPLSTIYTRKVPHTFGPHIHETDRNHGLVTSYWPMAAKHLPKLYPTLTDYDQVRPYQSLPYICIAPASVWFTKQWPAEKWIDVLDDCPADLQVYILGGPADHALGEQIEQATTNTKVDNLAGKLPFLASAALMQGAQMNFTCDSAPLHIAGAMGAPVRAIFCSTIPAFGFGPMAELPFGGIIEITTPLDCRPCGLHGLKACPLGHFKCAYQIETQQVLAAFLPQ